MNTSPSWRERWAEAFGIDLRTLALFRFALASVIFVDVFRRLFDARAFLTDAGVLPRDVLIELDGFSRLNLYLINGDTWFAVLLLVITLLCAFLLALGWRTRLASVLLFALLGSVENRNPLVLSGGDLLIMALTFWMMFLPVGARWSVDAALAANPPPRRNRHVSWASAGLLIQVMSVYFFSAILKNGADWWPDGLGVYYALSLDRFATPAGEWLLGWPRTMHALSYFVYFLEWCGPVLIFLPLTLRTVRPVVMLLFMAMHLGFIVCLDLGHFPFVSLSSLTTFIGGWIWDRAPRGRPVRIFYDRDCGFCWKMCLLMKVFLALPDPEIRPAQDDARAGPLLERHYSWVIFDDQDRAHLKWDGFIALLRASPLFGWTAGFVGWAGWRRIGTAAYDFVGRHRGGFGTLSAALLPQREVRFEAGPLAQGLAALATVMLLVWNLGTVGWLPKPQVDAVTLTPIRLLRLDQFWNMFAPFPSRADGWLVFDGTLEDGTPVDALHPGKALSWDKPRLISATHVNYRWHVYQWRIWEKKFASQRGFYGRYLCREWNRTAPPGKHLLHFNMTWVEEWSQPPGTALSLSRNVGWKHDCVSRPAPPAAEPVGSDRPN